MNAPTKTPTIWNRGRDFSGEVLPSPRYPAMNSFCCASAGAIAPIAHAMTALNAPDALPQPAADQHEGREQHEAEADPRQYPVHVQVAGQLAVSPLLPWSASLSSLQHRLIQVTAQTARHGGQWPRVRLSAADLTLIVDRQRAGGALSAGSVYACGQQ